MSVTQNLYLFSLWLIRISIAEVKCECRSHFSHLQKLLKTNVQFNLHIVHIPIQTHTHTHNHQRYKWYDIYSIQRMQCEWRDNKITSTQFDAQRSDSSAIWTWNGFARGAHTITVSLKRINGNPCRHSNHFPNDANKFDIWKMSFTPYTTLIFHFFSSFK